MMQKIFVDSGSGNHYFRIMDNDAQIYIKLADAVTVTAGYPLRRSAEALDDGDVRLIQLKNTNPDGAINWMEVASISLPSKREPNWLTNEDVIFSARGTRTFAYPLDNVPPKTVCAPQFFVLSIRNTNDLSPHFLAWQINQKPAQDYFQRNATGSHILNIRRSVLEELTITVPNIQKQMMIVTFWQAAQRERSLLNSLIENRNSQLEALAAGLAPNGKEARI
ncbi:restriction endonuclease subunit S [Pseudahrensia aquimaris]|uniref:Restriction endonuclease subunit S n=1 Tax=Pseudahrensia aquimaris TaxID=744461 RepID=A0ABW3FJ37_9HYPH